MHRLFRTMGYLHYLEDANGNPVPDSPAQKQPVWADVWYELKPSPNQPLQIEIYGQNLWAMGQTKEQLVLDNGVVLTGRAYGGGFGSPSGEVTRARLFDIEELKIELHPTKTAPKASDVDSIIFAVVSSYPLGHGICANGWARPGFPFSYRANCPTERKTTWSSRALRLHYGQYEVSIVETSSYWKKIVGNSTLQQDAIVGIRRSDRAVMEWREINRVSSLISKFIGWINHCRSPVFHIKGYQKGKLVYKGYNSHPHPTVRRDLFSWLPMFLPDGKHEVQANLLQSLLEGFAKVWAKNEQQKGVFHIALDLLGSRSKGSPQQSASIGYLRDTITACSILVGMLVGASNGRGRYEVIRKCLEKIGVEDKIPVEDREEIVRIMNSHPELWSRMKGSKVIREEKGTISRPIANVGNWLLHIDNPSNAAMLLGLSSWVQQFLVEVSTWLADLMILKVIGYKGWYFNRLTGEAEMVPWVGQGK